MGFRTMARWLFLITFAGNILLCTRLWQKFIGASLEILSMSDGPAARIVIPPPPTIPFDDGMQRVTDLVIPMTAGQVNRIVINLDTWKEFPPCSLSGIEGEQLDRLPRDVHEFYDTHPHVGTNITLTFAVSGRTDQGAQDQILAAYASLPESARKCFSRARVRFGQLTGDADRYPEGSRNVFEMFLNGTFTAPQPHYALYMEPDMLPVRKYWLSAIDALTRKPAETFWIRGSMYRGDQRITTPHYALHINGNAVYNLRDARFQEFYFKTVKPVIKGHPGRDGYDSDLYLYMLDPQYDDEASRVRRNFQYTEVIHNMWHAGYSVRNITAAYPSIYLVHGGTRSP